MSFGLNGTEFSKQYETVLVVVVGVTCLLSVLGAGTIILSFVLFRDLRTTMRFILLQLSIADLIVAVTNLYGVFHSIESLVKAKDLNSHSNLCVAQAAIGLFGTDASILLTVIFILYVLLLVKCYRLKQISKIAILCLLTLFSWALPLVLVSVFAGKRYFGYRPKYSPAFCSIYTTNNAELVRQIVGYEMFLFTSFLILPILSSAFVCHLHFMVSDVCICRYSYSKLLLQKTLL